VCPELRGINTIALSWCCAVLCSTAAVHGLVLSDPTPASRIVETHFLRLVSRS
jgi:hypothetical protein